MYAVLLPLVGPVTRSTAAAVGVLVNVISHPLLWFVLAPLVDRVGGHTLAVVAIPEIAVWLLEAALCRLFLRLGPALRLGGAAALEVTAVANLASLGLGLVLLSA